MRKRQKDIEGQEPFAPSQPAPSSAAKPVTALDIQQKEFRYARFGGYKMRDVDEFLDRVTESMSAVVSENERLRAGGVSPSPVLGTPDLDDVGRQADEIIQRARDEAAKIVADARAQAGAAVVVGGAGAATQSERAAINAFLAREKEFLQSLAGLVQDHAGAVKEMAKDARSRGAAPVSPATAKPATAPAAPPARSPEKVVAPTPAAASSDAPSPAATPVSTEAPAPVRASSPAPDDATISLPRAEEPAAAGVRRDGGDDDARESGDSSLRELFWGEE